MKRLNWRRTPKPRITARLCEVCSMYANRHLTGKELAKKYFTGITRGGLIVHCWRQGIALPRTRAWPHPPRARIGRRRHRR